MKADHFQILSEKAATRLIGSQKCGKAFEILNLETIAKIFKFI